MTADPLLLRVQTWGRVVSLYAEEAGGGVTLGIDLPGGPAVVALLEPAQAAELRDALTGWLGGDLDEPAEECRRCQHSWHDGMCLALVPETAGNVRGMCPCPGSR